MRRVLQIAMAASIAACAACLCWPDGASAASDDEPAAAGAPAEDASPGGDDAADRDDNAADRDDDDATDRDDDDGDAPDRNAPPARESRDGDRSRGKRDRDDDRPPMRRGGPEGAPQFGPGPEGGAPRGPGPFPRRDGDFRPPLSREAAEAFAREAAEGRRPPFGPSLIGPPGLFGAPRDAEIVQLEARDSQLERQCLTLSDFYRRSEGDSRGREQIAAQIAKVVDEHFRVRQQRRERELTLLAEQLERLRASIREREDSRDTIIQRRVDELTGKETLDF